MGPVRCLNRYSSLITKCEAVWAAVRASAPGPACSMRARGPGAVLDRMQPLWCQRYLLGQRPVRPLECRRPLDLFVVGAGGDPFGHDALVSCARSSLRMADFELRVAHDLVGFGQAPRPGCAYGPDFDAALLSNVSAWASDLVHAAQAARDLR